jgi:hypothetical protein
VKGFKCALFIPIAPPVVHTNMRNGGRDGRVPEVMRCGAVCFATVDASRLCCTFLRIVSFPCRSPVRLCCLMRVSSPPGDPRFASDCDLYTYTCVVSALLLFCVFYGFLCAAVCMLAEEVGIRHRSAVRLCFVITTYTKRNAVQLSSSDSHGAQTQQGNHCSSLCVARGRVSFTARAVAAMVTVFQSTSTTRNARPILRSATYL